MQPDSPEMRAIYAGSFYSMPTCALDNRCFLVIRCHELLKFGILLEANKTDFTIGEFFAVNWDTEELEAITAKKPLQAIAARYSGGQDVANLDYAALYREQGAYSQLDFHGFVGCLATKFAAQDAIQANRLSELHQTAIANKFFTSCLAAHALDVDSFKKEIEGSSKAYGVDHLAVVKGQGLEAYRDITVELGVKLALSYAAGD